MLVIILVASVFTETICQMRPRNANNSLTSTIERLLQQIIGFASAVYAVWVSLFVGWLFYLGIAFLVGKSSRFGSDGWSQISLAFSHQSIVGFAITGLMIYYFVFFVKYNKKELGERYSRMSNYLADCIAQD